MRIDPMRLTFFAFLSAILLFAACRKQEDFSQATPAQTSTTTVNVHRVPENMPTRNPVAPPQRDLPSRRVPAAAGSERQVDLIEYSIHLPSTLPPGHQTLNVSDAGKENHSLVIEGNGTRVELPTQLTRGDTTTLDVDLKSGTYTAWCPVDGHRGKGMSTTFTVAAKP
ncbi:MAG: hypothetical protein JWO56_290 [Acidobacteria bacterium]|nr:hypothetical protein [Acidobacteriota bacterium]